MVLSQGANTRMPHRPQTTDGTTASRSITYTIGRDQRRGTTSVSSSAMATLTGTDSTTAMIAVTAVPKMNASAPKWPAATSQLFVKILMPSALNHDVDCWL